MKGKFVIYQMLPRVFGNTHAVNRPGGTLAENGTGKFKDITVSVLEEIRKLNVSYIWYTGIVRHAVAGDPGVKGGAGSPFAITDWYDVNPYLASRLYSIILETVEMHTLHVEKRLRLKYSPKKIAGFVCFGMLGFVSESHAEHTPLEEIKRHPLS